jgi:spore coat polysaccharide biosynthesis predicted glycosyltransferase SpsG
MSRFVYIRDSSKELGKGHSYHSSVVSQRLAPFEGDTEEDTVIVDALDPFPALERIDRWDKLVLFNCLHPEDHLGVYERHVANVIVTPDVSPLFENARDENKIPRQVWFRGPRYWFLRDEFNLPEEKPIPFYEVGVMIGGTDPLNLTEKIQEQLRSVLVVHGEDIAFQMRMCRTMLTGCGQSFWESLRCGVPAIPFASNEAQAKQYGESFRLGSVSDIRGMLDRGEVVRPDAKWQIGEGWREVVEAILR